MVRVGFGLLALLSLAACAPQRMDDLLVPCPTLVLPADLADMTRHAPGAQPDLSTLVLDARVTAIDGTCRRGSRDRSIESTIAVRFQIDRGPAATGRAVQLPWFLALLDARTDQVVSRQSFVMNGQFGVNTTRANVTSQPVEISFPVGAERSIQDYRVLVGFLLTEDELAANRRRGPR
jgi:hypothetical protein